MEKKLLKSRTDKKICGVCGGLAKYFGEFEEGTELYIELLAKDSELYVAMYHENETPEYQKLLTDTAKDVHNSMMDSVF